MKFTKTPLNDAYIIEIEPIEDNVEVFYMVSQKYSTEYEQGIRWNDPEFNISWPIDPTIISERDSSWKLYS